MDGGDTERCAQTQTLHGNFDDEITAIWQYILAEFQMAKIDTHYIVCVLYERICHSSRTYLSRFITGTFHFVVLNKTQLENGGAFNVCKCGLLHAHFLSSHILHSFGVTFSSFFALAHS